MKAIVWTGQARGSRPTWRCGTCRANEVRVRIHAAGLCHSDVSVVNGTIPFPTPAVLGHEGAGVVEEVGDAVSQGEGRRPRGAHHPRQLRPVRRLRPRPAHPLPRHRRQAQGARSPWAARRRSSSPTPACSPSTPWCSETQAVVIDPDVPLASASLIGCAVLTGTGAVLNRAKPRTGQSAMVIGIGGIGLNVLQGLALAELRPDHRRRHQPGQGGGGQAPFGATHFIVRRTRRRHRSPRSRRSARYGVDYAFECVGHPALIRQCDRPARLGRQLRAARRAQVRHRGQLRGQDALQRQVASSAAATARPARTTTSRCSSTSTRPASSSSTSWCRPRFAPEQVQDALDAMHGGGLNRAVLDFAD